jgi:hypothetical protein
VTRRALRAAVSAISAAALLAACSAMPSFLGLGGAEKPKPAELPPNVALIAVRPEEIFANLARRARAQPGSYFQVSISSAVVAR